MGSIHPGAQCTTEAAFAERLLHAFGTQVHVRAPSGPARADIDIQATGIAGAVVNHGDAHQARLGIAAATAHARAHGPGRFRPGHGPGIVRSGVRRRVLSLCNHEVDGTHLLRGSALLIR